jgi:hypothetical protein
LTDPGKQEEKKISTGSLETLIGKAEEGNSDRLVIHE